MIQNAAENFQISPLPLSSHSELRNLKKLSALWACSVSCIGINLCSSYKLQLHLLRSSEVVPQLEVKIKVHPYSWFKRVKTPFKLLLGRFVCGILVFFVEAGWEWQKLHPWLSGFSRIKPWLTWSAAGLGTTLSKSLVGREEMSPTFLCLYCRTAAFYPCLINEQCLINARHSVGFQ